MPSADATRLARGGLLARNTVLNVGGQLVPLAVGAASIPYILHALGPARFGLLSIGWVILSSLGALDLGLGTAATKYVAAAFATGSSPSVRRLAWASVVPQLALGLLGAAGLWLAAGALCSSVLRVPQGVSAEGEIMLRVIALGVPAVLVAGAFKGILAATQRFELINAVSVPSRAAALLLPAVGAWLGWGLGGIAVLLVASRYITGAAYYALAALAVPELRLRPLLARADLRVMLQFGGWVAAGGVLGPALLYFDRFILGRVAGLTALALYAAPFEILSRLAALSGGLAATLLPAWSALHASGAEAELAALYVKALKYLLLGVAWILPAALLVMFWALPLWLGSRFGDAALLPARLLLAGFGVAALAPIPGTLLLALGRPDVVPKLFAFEIPLNAGCVWWLTSLFGIVGGAASFALRAMFETAFLFWVVPRVSGGKLRGIWRALRRPAIISLFWVVLAIWAEMALSGLAPVAVLGAGVLLFPLISWHWALAPADRAGLGRKLHQLRAAVGMV